jgi:hypothetical protein
MNKEERTDSLKLIEGSVKYICEDSLVWEFFVSELWLIGEWTDTSGPADDYFYYFIAGKPARTFEAPMYSNPQFLRDLAKYLNTRLELVLVDSTEHRSCVIWPLELEGQELFDYEVFRRGSGIWNRMKDQIFPLVRSQLSTQVIDYLRRHSIA